MAQRDPQLDPGENVIRSGSANLHRGVENVGGKLHLTNQHLAFVPHAVNVQKANVRIPLSEITSVEPVWTKFLKVIPMVPNSLAVRLRDESELRFVLTKRLEWKQEIEKYRS